jgi:photosystem II stability/assembly factor-like uncharacterized protein
VAVAFSDAEHGIAVGDGWGYGPAIVQTEDGGRTWHGLLPRVGRIPCGGRETIGGVALRPTGVGMVACNAGAVYKTADHGRTWTETNQHRALPLASIAMVSDNTAVAVGRRGVIVRTEDGGSTWFPVDSGTLDWFSRVAFADERRGLIVGWGGLVLSTEDGGRTWHRDSPLTIRNLYALAFAPSGDAVVGGANGLVLLRAWPQRDSVRGTQGSGGHR